MANSLNHSSLKKRITMMLKDKSNPWARLKYLYVLPLACITMFTFARPEVSRMEALSTQKVNDLMVLTQVEKATIENQSTDKVSENSGYLKSGEVKKAEGQSHSGFDNLLAINKEKNSESTTQKSTNKMTEPAALVLSVSGKVISSKTKQPLSSVCVIIMDNSNRGIGVTVTKRDGTFELVSKSNIHTLHFSHVGYKNTTSSTDDCKTVQMDETTRALDEAEVVGYSSPAVAKIEVKASNHENQILVEQDPSYPGGEKAFSQYIKESLRYPTKAIARKIEGCVVCSFVINTEGKVTDVKVVTPVDPDLDKEAVRVIENMGNWIPAMQNGEKCPVNFSIPIRFSIHK